MSNMNDQVVMRLFGGKVEELRLPPPDSVVMGSIPWGAFDSLFTPAFWVSRLWIESAHTSGATYALTNTLDDEIVACLLGGFGMPAEIGLAAFYRLKGENLLIPGTSARDIEQALLRPLSLGSKQVRYRYPRQRARYVEAALRRLVGSRPEGVTANKFRDWLLEFPGIGLKTASWITRNWLRSDEVAILDIHLQRAGVLMGLFSKGDDVARNYMEMERLLVYFAKALGVKLSNLDDLIWRFMRGVGPVATEAYENVEFGRRSEFELEEAQEVLTVA